MLGRLYYEQGDSIALDYFRNAINIQPGSIEAHYNIAMFYQENNLPHKAIIEYDNIISNIDSTYYYAYYNKGLVHYRKKEYEKAVSAYRKCLEIKPDYAEGHANLGLAYLQSENLALALQSLDKSLSIKPTLPQALFGKALVYEKQGKFDEALAYAEKARLNGATISPEFYKRIKEKQLSETLNPKEKPKEKEDE